MPMSPCSLPTTILLNRLRSVLKKYLQQGRSPASKGDGGWEGSGAQPTAPSTNLCVRWLTGVGTR